MKSVSSAFKEPIPDKALKGHEISSENVTSEGSCRVLCFMEPKCVSINVGPFEEGKHRCELNDVTAEQNDSTNALENMPGYTHLSIEVIIKCYVRCDGEYNK